MALPMVLAPAAASKAFAIGKTVGKVVGKVGGIFNTGKPMILYGAINQGRIAFKAGDRNAAVAAVDTITSYAQKPSGSQLTTSVQQTATEETNKGSNLFLIGGALLAVFLLMRGGR